MSDDFASKGEDVLLTRLLKRCEGGGMSVPREVAERILTEEEGHVGKAMICLRRLYPRAS